MIPPLPPGVPRNPPASPPRSGSVPLYDNTTLKVGDVVQVAVQLKDKHDGSLFWWKRFAVVMRRPGKYYIEVLTLKLHPDMDRDLRVLDLQPPSGGAKSREQDRPQIVTRLEEPWPQGVAATHMALLARRIIKLEDE